jgi:hypothetical protein
MSELLNDDVDVCIDCYMDHHEGRAMADTSVDWTDNTRQEGDDENGDPSGVTDFSWSACGCCGSTLGGQRFRMATWSID